MHRLKIALSQPRGRVCSPSIFMRALLFFLGLAQSMTFRIFCEGGGKETVFDNSLVFFFMIISTWTHRKVGQYHFKVHRFRLLVDTSFQIIQIILFS